MVFSKIDDCPPPITQMWSNHTNFVKPELIMTLSIWYWGNQSYNISSRVNLIHWDRVTHICVGKLAIIGSDNGLSPERHQAIIWTNAGILLIGSLGTILNEISIGIQTFSFKKMHLKMSSAKWRPFCLGLKEAKPIRNQSLVMINYNNQVTSQSNSSSDFFLEILAQCLVA